MEPVIYKTNIDTKSLSISNLVLNILEYGGQIGNLIFIISSAWFLVDSNEVKPDKVFKILIDSLIIVLAFFLGSVILGYKFTFVSFLDEFFSNFSSGLWFIVVYILLYSIHPLLNKIINSIGRRQYFAICFAFLCTYGVLGFMYKWDFGISYLGKFVAVYLLVGFFKRYCLTFCTNIKWNIVTFCLFFLLFVLLVMTKKILPMSMLDSTASEFHSLLILFPMVLCLFNIFNAIKFNNKLVNYLASCSLFVYCFHNNSIIKMLVRQIYYIKVFEINVYVYFWWIVLCGVGMFVGGYILSIIYKHTISKLTAKISKKMASNFEKISNKAYGMFFKD